MPITQTYTRGVKYIKIAKVDSGSVDNSIELENLTDIRIKFTDINNPIQYNVASISEYPTYYLYTIVPTDITSSANQEILNYKISASGGSPTGGGLLIGYTTQSGTNTLGYFDGTFLNMGNTPNIQLNISFSLSQSSGLDVTMSLYPYNTSSTPTIIGPSLIDLYFPAGSGYITRSGSFTPIEGYSYGFDLDVPSNYFNSYFTITQSVATQSSNYDIVVLEPYVGANFYNSDCNVIQNNVDINTVSPFFMDVDFTNSPIVAQNQASILNGTATRAQIQQWNYTYYSQISGRYIGKQQNAIAINVYTSASQFITASQYGFTGSWPGDTTSPSIPIPGNIVIQWLDSCIYEINWAAGGYPENTNGGGINMGNIYLVGETKDDVAIIKPGTDIYYDILAKTFPSGTIAYQYQYSNTNGIQSPFNITYPALEIPSAKYSMPSNAQTYFSSIPYAGTFTPNSASIPVVVFSQSNAAGIYGTTINNGGNLSTTNVGAILFNGLVNEISSSINNGGRWFVSLYSGSGPSSSPYSGLGFVATSSNIAQYGYPFEIASAYSSSNFAYITLKTGSGAYNVSSFFSGSLTTPIPIGYSGSGVSTTGLLISKANTPSNNMTIVGVPSLNFAGTGQGYILSQYPKKVITENIDYILKTYGNNPN